jgi:isomaltose glucohydrolase
MADPQLKEKVEQLIAAAGIVADTAVRSELAEDLTGRAMERCVPLLDRNGAASAVPEHILAWTSQQVLDIEAELTDGGVHRYLDDVYYGGGQWVLLAGFLGWAHAARGDRERARELLTWMTDQARPSGDLPEQVATVLLHPDHEQPWIDRWGPSACPLLWSHAMFLVLASELGVLPD